MLFSFFLLWLGLRKKCVDVFQGLACKVFLSSKKRLLVRVRSGNMVGDLMPPPPTTYESLSSCRKAARETLRYTRHGKGTVSEGVRPGYVQEEAVGRPLNHHDPGDLIHHNRDIGNPTIVYDRGRGVDQQLRDKMETMGEKEELTGGQIPARTEGKANP
jgi:hypothetical protein